MVTAQAAVLGGSFPAPGTARRAWMPEQLPAMNVDELTAKLKAFAQGREYVVAMYLFGSHASGYARRDSDVDIAVLVRPDGSNLLDLEIMLDIEIGKQLSGYKTEVLVVNRAPVPFRFEVISTGRLLHSNDERFRTDWEVNVLSDYWDIRPFLQEYDREYFRRLKEGFTDAQWREYYRARATLAGKN